MSKVLLFASLLAFVAIGLIMAGCSKQQSSHEPATSPEASHNQPVAAEGEAHEGHQHGEAGTAEHAEHAMHNQYEDVLADLSPEDRALAEKQKVCPVSGEPLGAMGKPYKVTVEGREVFLCCPGCEAKIKENPAEYLAKLPQ